VSARSPTTRRLGIASDQWTEGSERSAPVKLTVPCADGCQVRLGIFGSCVTRDLFEDPALRPTLARYASRSSLISAVAAPVALDPERVRLDSAFQRRCVIEDFDKCFLAELPSDRLDWLVVDLIDERFDVLRTAAAASYVTCSSAYRGAGLEQQDDFERVRRLTGEASELLERAAQRFAERVTAVLAPERVIVHRAHWMTRYRDGAELHDFAAERVDFAERHNAAVDQGYDVLERALGGRAQTIALNGGFVADANHRWELEPYHYEPAYNAAALERLRTIVGS